MFSNKIFFLSNIFLLCLSLALTAPTAPGGTRRGQCEGPAYNYVLSVPSREDCAEICNCDSECGQYSYHHADEAGPHHNHCYLYTSCPTLRYNSQDSHWLTGDKSSSPTCSSASLTNPLLGGFQHISTFHRST